MYRALCVFRMNRERDECEPHPTKSIKADHFCVLLYSDEDVVIPSQTYRSIPCSVTVSLSRSEYGMIYLNESLFRLGLVCSPFRYHDSDRPVHIPVNNCSATQCNIKKNDLIGKMYIETNHPFTFIKGGSKVRIQRLPCTSTRCTAAN